MFISSTASSSLIVWAPIDRFDSDLITTTSFDRGAIWQLFSAVDDVLTIFSVVKCKKFDKWILQVFKTVKNCVALLFCLLSIFVTELPEWWKQNKAQKESLQKCKVSPLYKNEYVTKARLRRCISYTVY